MTFSIKSTAGRGGFASSQSFNPNSITEGGVAGRGAEETPRPAAAPRLVRATATSWTHEREQEAREAGYQVVFDVDADTLIASFWNGPFFCYSREWTP